MSDEGLLEKINAAVKAVNEAEQNIETARTELVSRSKAVGALLLEAKQQHPTKKDLEAFLKKVDGIKSISWAYDLMRLAGGRVTDEELKKEARERQQKKRVKDRQKPKPIPKPAPDPVRDVTDRPRITGNDVDPVASAEQRKAEAGMPPPERATKESAHNLAEFIVAARMYLPKITVQADREKAHKLVAELLGDRKAAAA